MIEQELERIERELEIKLPNQYKDKVKDFPIPALANNSEYELWDNAEDLITLNNELRKGRYGLKPWPHNLFAIGQIEGDPSCRAIDLNEPESPVLWMDHCDAEEKSSGVTHNNFSEWIKEFVKNISSDLESDGIDPLGSFETRAVVEQVNAANSRKQLFIGAIVIILAALIYLLVR